MPRLACLLLVALACSRDPSHPDWRSKDGYRELRWGMTRSEVKRLMPGLKEDLDGSMVGTEEVAGYRATLTSHFEAERLTNVVLFVVPYPDKLLEGTAAVFGEMLRTRYGAFTGQGRVFDEDYRAWAPKGDTRVVLAVSKELVTIRVLYLSTHLDPLVEKYR